MKRFKVASCVGAICAFAVLASAEDKTKTQDEIRTDRISKSADSSTHKANEMIGASVQNKSGEKLGTVRDLAFELPTGRLAYLIVASGGILGLGADHHAVPPKTLSHDSSTPRILTIDIAKDRWDASPKFKKDQLTGLNAHRDEIEKYFADAAHKEDVKAEANVGDAKAEVKIKTPDISSTASRDSEATLHLATELIGKQVVTKQNEDVGKISDLLVDMKDAKVAFAIISTGTLLKPADTRYAVATRNLSKGTEKNKIVLHSDRAALESAPMFDQERFKTSGRTSGSVGIFKYQDQDKTAKAEINTGENKKSSAEISASAGTKMTAFSLIKEGNRYIGDQAKDKVVQIRSEKSVNGVTPSTWYVVFYDPTAALKATEVKFSNEQMVDVKRPLRLLEATSNKKSEPLDREKLKIDSDKALETALEEPAVKDRDVTASEMRLERGEGGIPTWRIELWGTKANDSKGDISLGTVSLSAEDGKVLRSDLKANRVD
jgi:sporulation protein YlmC with PRC-barrel domain